MSRLGALNGKGPAAPLPLRPIEPGTVATTATDLDDDVYVTLERFGNSTLRIGPVLGWRTADPDLWPSRGNRCAITRVEQGDYWFIGWEPE